MWGAQPASSSTHQLEGGREAKGARREEAACSSGQQRGDQAPIHPSIIQPVYLPRFTLSIYSTTCLWVMDMFFFS